MKTTMDMSNCEIEQDAMEVEHGEEILSSGWDPVLSNWLVNNGCKFQPMNS